MRIKSLKTSRSYDIEIRNLNGENYMPCPECAQNRKHKNKKSFSFNMRKEAGYCHNCEASFVVYRERTQPKFKVPEVVNNTGLSDKAVQWFEGRAINKQTLNELKIYTKPEWMPQFEAVHEAICFPYYRYGQLINVKFRGPQKSFKLVKDAELIFWNIDSIIEARDYAIITEGEIDAMSFHQIGLTQVVSVPNGAKGNNLEYLDTAVDVFEKIAKVYIATDTDEKGIELRDELTRRIGAEKCYIIDYAGCKDANEVIQKHGGLKLRECYNKARFATVAGIVDLSAHKEDLLNLFKNGMKSGNTIGLADVDKAVTWELGRLATVTGIPGHGKSEFVDYITVRLNIEHGWKTAYFSPENWPTMYHLSKLIPKVTGKQFKPDITSEAELLDVYDYIEDNYYWIAPEDDQRFESIIELATVLVKQRGIKVLVIDPYNKIEHMRDKNETETEYISRFLDKLIMFAKTFSVLVMLVAHPRKMQTDKETKKITMPNLYDINGSANFYNKSDYGIVVYRDYENNVTTVSVQKVKFKHLGEGGDVYLTYNYHSGRYNATDVPMIQWDKQNWYYQKVNKEQILMNNFTDTAIKTNQDFDFTPEPDNSLPF